MRWRAKQAQRAIDLAAAGALAGAAGFAAAALAGGTAAALPAALITAWAAFALAYAGLGRIDGDRPIALAHFDPAPLEPAAQELAAAAPRGGDETVIRLFDPRQLHIARPSAGSPDFAPHHAGQAAGAAGPAIGDAGQALSEALADLKRSLRQ